MHYGDKGHSTMQHLKGHKFLDDHFLTNSFCHLIVKKNCFVNANTEKGDPELWQPGNYFREIRFVIISLKL